MSNADEIKGRQGLPPIGPQSDQLFIPGPGVYAAAMWNVKLPDKSSEFGLGWDATFQLRRSTHATTCWELLFRYRHYRGRNSLFDGKDLFRWHQFRLGDLDEAAAMSTIDRIFAMVLGLDRDEIKIDCLPIRGGFEQFIKVVDEDKREWFHFQFSTAV